MALLTYPKFIRKHLKTLVSDYNGNLFKEKSVNTLLKQLSYQQPSDSSEVNGKIFTDINGAQISPPKSNKKHLSKRKKSGNKFCSFV